ncbi:MAG: hypothetical protein HY257_06350 [Chloroflexi bacterium]|nr:hypothetical protein [Chloroflexota bacterium]
MNTQNDLRVPLECQNCGAPLHPYKESCDFCGTHYAVRTENSVEENALPAEGVALFAKFGDGKLQVTLTENLRDAIPKPLRDKLSEPSSNFVDEIKTIAQRRLMRAGFRIWFDIIQQPDGSLAFQIADQIYPSIREIPDPEIREHIQLAVDEWQSNP